MEFDRFKLLVGWIKCYKLFGIKLKYKVNKYLTTTLFFKFLFNK